MALVLLLIPLMASCAFKQPPHQQKMVEDIRAYHVAATRYIEQCTEDEKKQCYAFPPPAMMLIVDKSMQKPTILGDAGSLKDVIWEASSLALPVLATIVLGGEI
jgi:hypothetical protein